MRPRPDAAENPIRKQALRLALVQASMRPRPDAAENLGSSAAAEAAALASMRPRPDAAENLGTSLSDAGSRTSLQ